MPRLIASTNAQVIFISETKNSSITSSDLINRFNLDNAHIVSTDGLSGGLWVMSRSEVQVEVVDSCRFYVFASCFHKAVRKKFGLVCIYGDPYHEQTKWIWQYLNSVVL
jgi:hypothetical protein